jgi:hypothetical protein
MKPAFDSRAHQDLGIGQRDVVRCDWNIILMRFVDDGEIQLRREFFRAAAPIVNPDFDEVRLDPDVVPHGLARLFDRRYRIWDVHTRRMTVCAGSRPPDSRTDGAEQRRTRYDFITHPQRHVIPMMLQMVDQVFAREILFGHRSIPIVLVSDVAVQIDLWRHYGLSRQIDAHRVGGNLQLPATSNARKRVSSDDENRVLDRAAVARDQAGVLLDRHAVRV